MRYLLFLSLFLISACNVYDLTGNGNQYSDNFEDLLSQPSISFNPSKLSIAEINTAGTSGITITFTISNAQFNDFTTAGQVDNLTFFSTEGTGSVTDLTLPSIANKVSVQNFTLLIKNNGTDSTLTGEQYFKVEIPTGSYTSNSNQDLEFQDYYIELVQ